jgi:hypothetical protein
LRLGNKIVPSTSSIDVLQIPATRKKITMSQPLLPTDPRWSDAINDLVSVVRGNLVVLHGGMSLAVSSISNTILFLDSSFSRSLFSHTTDPNREPIAA